MPPITATIERVYVHLARVKRRSGAEGAACSVQIGDVAAKKQDGLRGMK